MDIRRIVLMPDLEGKIRLPNYEEFTKFVDIFAVDQRMLRTNEKVGYKFDGRFECSSILLPDILRNIDISNIGILCEVSLSSRLMVVYSTSRSMNYLLTVCENMRHGDKPYYERLEGFHITYVFGQIHRDLDTEFNDHIESLENNQD